MFPGPVVSIPSDRDARTLRYLLHQTATVIAVYWLLTMGVPPVAGFFAAIVATFVGTWAIYAGLVRPWRWVRPLFGMKAVVRSAALKRA